MPEFNSATSEEKRLQKQLTEARKRVAKLAIDKETRETDELLKQNSAITTRFAEIEQKAVQEGQSVRNEILALRNEPIATKNELQSEKAKTRIEAIQIDDVYAMSRAEGRKRR